MTIKHASALIALLFSMSCSDSTSLPPDIAKTSFAPALGVDLAAMTVTSSGLYYRDLVAGTGVVVGTGNFINVTYSGYLPDGTKFDSGTYGFRVGASTVIKGWDQGLLGVRVGSRRQLVIPPSLGYGSAAQQGIPANSILVFTIDIVSLQ